MKTLILLGLMMTSSLALALEQTSCETYFNSKDGALLAVTLNPELRDHDALEQIFETSDLFSYEPKFNGLSSWRYVAKDKSIIVSHNVSAGINLHITGIAGMSANAIAPGACVLTGPAANVIFDVLAGSTSSLVTKEVRQIHGGEMPSTQVTLLSKKLSCIDTIYGSPREVKTCTFFP